MRLQTDRELNVMTGATDTLKDNLLPGVYLATLQVGATRWRGTGRLPLAFRGVGNNDRDTTTW